MMPCKRPSAPAWLQENWAAWGEEFARHLAEKPSYEFRWKTWREERVNIRLLPLLRHMTEGHCAYCDWFPMDTGTDPTIDHFRPKKPFPKQVYAWDNLYLCCRQCQEKNDNRFTEELLRPDEPGYAFERFFIYNHADGTLSPNPGAPEEEHRRAELTIDLFRLNSRGRPQARKRTRKLFLHLMSENRKGWIPELPFRYLFQDESSDFPPRSGYVAS
uniref:TIGR02646 family protein n=1 Tax=Candidatus Kentrum sp. DK TaxID=2126562 RepID=A0A450SC13_9GAMM|nr:MAG: TIGR02646 family protein [Candidatus Kentron sp. DK]